MTAPDPRAPDPTELDAEPVSQTRSWDTGSGPSAGAGRAERGDIEARAEQVIRTLIEKGASVATAESLTGGLVCAALTSVPGASAVVFGGVASYSTDVKIRVLGVPAEVIAEHGTVAAETALWMADGVRELTGATVGVATTGVAGPDPIESHPVGTAFVAVTTGVMLSRPVGRESERTVRALHQQGSREQIRRQTVTAALELVTEVLSDPGDGA